MSWRGEAEEDVVRQMAALLAHRGPDGDGFWRDPTGRAVLGHRRLRVLDPSPRADQPMVDASGLVLVYNGEVYSFRQLRHALEERGRAVTSTGDTEVVLAALAEWGVAALERCNGMFAFALWDPKRGRLLLARDRIGIKPLFWALVPGGLAFASEVPALLAHPGVARRLQPESMARWLQLGYTCGQRTVIEGVRRLPPGHILEADGSEIKVTPWYDLASRVEASGPGPASAEEAAEALDPLLRDSVRIRLVSDVPLGCFLSGGVDSTAVVAAAVAEGTRPETVTVRFEGGADESPVARTTAAALGVDHRVEPCSAQEMGSVVARWARLAGDPIADPSLAPTWVVSRAARLRWTVALSGDGGDELLGGYPRLRLAPRLDSLLRAPSSLRRLATPLLPKRRWGVKLAAAWQTASAWQAYQALQGVWPATRAAALVGVDCTALPWPHELVRRLEAYPTDQRYRLLDALTFLPERVLAKVDRASMDRSLEVRVPLLDHRVVELLLSLPGSVVKGKQPLRRVLARLGGPQPPRAKRGFEVPLGQWLRGPLRDTVEADLLGSGAADLGLDPKALRQAWDTHQSGAADLSERLLAVAVLVGWARELGLTR